MKVSYKELNSKVSGDLKGLSVAQSNKGKVMLVQDSTFEQVPTGAKAKLKSVSFSKLESGDFVVISTNDSMAVRRFLKLDLTKGTTKLIVSDGSKQEQAVPFTRLVGRVDKVRKGTTNVDPNPTNVFQRLAFKLTYRFSS
jgi:mRNA-degrading endonuclease RelE of RelBE toxin-antitoxin system